MKLMVASDIHGGELAMEKLVCRIEEEKPDKLILLGDLLSHMPRFRLPGADSPRDVAEMLNELKLPIVAVRGNCDTSDDQDVISFPIMSEYVMLDFDGRVVYATHGHNMYSVCRLMDSPKQLLLKGHTHVPEFFVTENYTQINPGSVSQPRDGTPRSYAVLEGDTVSWRRVEDGTEFMKKTLP